MKIQIRGKNVEVTQSLSSQINKKLEKLDRHLGQETEAQVTLSVEKGFQRIEVTIPVYGMIVRAEEATSDMYSSLDLVVEKLEKQMSRYKGRLQKRGRTSMDESFAAKAPLEINPIKESEEEFQIVKSKKFAFKPMALEEAILQMKLLGHSFYVFSNSETEQVNVIYKRNDGKIGLIEPEF